MARRRIVPLIDTQIRRARPQESDYMLPDGSGLYLLVSAAGGKHWKYRCKIEGRDRKVSLGSYPSVTLAEARQRRDQVRRDIDHGIDPLAELDGQDETFEGVAREWHRIKIIPSLSESHAKRQLRRLEMYIFPWLGEKNVGEIKAPELLQSLRRIEQKGALETAHRVKVICGQVFRYGIVTGRCERDVSADLRDALMPVKTTHMPAITDPKGVAELLNAIDGYSGALITKCALQLAPLVFVRPGELRQAQWSEFDFDRKQWEIAADRMKMKEAHVVPLSKQALLILEELRPLSRGSQYLFPSVRTTLRPMSDNTLNAAFRRLGYQKDELTAHGFRAMARTLLDEELGERVDLIEHQLAHKVKDPLGRAYNRTKFLVQRAEMMQRWADYLETLKCSDAAD